MMRREEKLNVEQKDFRRAMHMKNKDTREEHRTGTTKSNNGVLGRIEGKIKKAGDLGKGVNIVKNKNKK